MLSRHRILMLAAVSAVCLAFATPSFAFEETIEQKKLKQSITDAREGFRAGKKVNYPPPPPKGMRSGAHSRPYASYMHGEVPQAFPGLCHYRSDLGGYYRLHAAEFGKDDMLRPTAVYKGEGYLAPGTWTGEEWTAPAEKKSYSWVKDANGKSRPSDVAGTRMVTTQAAPAPAR